MNVCSDNGQFYLNTTTKFSLFLLFFNFFEKKLSLFFIGFSRFYHFKIIRTIINNNFIYFSPSTRVAYFTARVFVKLFIKSHSLSTAAHSLRLALALVLPFISYILVVF